jgi:putative addiction module component (TIGR02574 family)
MVNVAELKTLPVAERLQLVEALWDSIAAENQNIPLPASQRNELRRRRAAYLKNPSGGVTWPELKAKIQKGHA